MNNPVFAKAQSAAKDWSYVPRSGYWDEAVLPSGSPRRHWRQLAVAARTVSFRQFDDYWRSGVQLLREGSVSHHNATDPGRHERPLPLDPIPFIIAEREWAQIEKAVVQRAALLNTMLSDLYGKQRLMFDYYLPPALVFGNPHFLRPCHGIALLSGAHLHTYAADLARSPDGQWWFIADRCQAPAGMGYVLENRLASARALPSIFNRCPVRQLGSFFDLRRDTLLAHAARNRRNPRAVVLTPGPANESYFEHSFLAKYWGFSLVEGDDLTVRDGRVHLKTLAGLEPVDLIIRYIHDDFCDPLELRGDSLLGVPGLVQAVRKGTVIIDNALGSGLIEAAGHLAFLPGLCRQLLGEDLRMPSVATWWCGQEKPCRYVLDHLDALVIKPASPSFGHEVVFPAAMDVAQRDILIGKIKSHPEQFVAQEGIELSTLPVLTDTGLAPRHLVLRVYAIWDGQSYLVMPGGLARVTAELNSQRLPASLGGVSKDTWVQGEREGVREPDPLPAFSVSSLADRNNLPSRAADNCFWLGRYAERVEAGVRLLRALLPALSAEEDFGRAVTVEMAMHILIALRFLPREVATSGLGEQRWRVQRFLTDSIYDPSRVSSLGWNLKEIRRVAWHLKERLSNDTWRVLQDLEAEFSRAVPVDSEHRFVAQIGVLDRAITTLSAFSGLLMENITRGEGWRFLEMGRRLERALQLADLLRAGVTEVPPEAQPYLYILLQVADSSMTYRTRYLSVLRTELVLQLLVADEANPRSIGFQMTALAQHYDVLETLGDGKNPQLGALVRASLEAIRSSSTDTLAQRDPDGRFPELEAFLQQLRGNLFEFAESLTAQYLSPAKAAHLTSSW